MVWHRFSFVSWYYGGDFSYIFKLNETFTVYDLLAWINFGSDFLTKSTVTVLWFYGYRDCTNVVGALSSNQQINSYAPRDVVEIVSNSNSSYRIVARPVDKELLSSEWHRNSLMRS